MVGATESLHRCNPGLVAFFEKKSMLNHEKNQFRRKYKMYLYESEILTVGTKWFSDKADAADLAILDKRINERAAEGWELVTYDYMATSMQIKGAFVITFRKEK